VPRLISLIFLVAIILLIGALSFQVMAQFLLPLFLAVILVIVFEPVHRYFLEKTKGRDRLAAVLTTGSILLIVLLPVGWILVSTAQEGFQLARQTEPEEMFERFDRMTRWLRPYASQIGLELPDSLEELVELANSTLQYYFRPAATRIVTGTIRFVVGTAIMIIALYFFLVDGPAMIAALMRLSPLDDRYELRLLEEFAQVSRAVVVATLLSAFVQGLLAGIAYWMAGFAVVFLLTTLTTLVAIIPFIGAAGVWVPCCLWLYFYEGRPVAAILLLLYGALVVSLADNVIKPLVLAGRANLHPLLALLSVLGGLQALGPIGIIVGPMVLSFLHALLLMLRDELGHYQQLTKQTEG